MRMPNFLVASLAQLAEHALRKRTVVGSIPTGGFHIGVQANLFKMIVGWPPALLFFQRVARMVKLRCVSGRPRC